MKEEMTSILEYLKSHSIPYSLETHNPIYTMEEGDKLNLPYKEQTAKNLFLTDDKKTHYYLIVLKQNRHLDIKELRLILSSRRLSFAPEKDLEELLALEKGAVTPFGVLNDKSRIVEVFIDRAFQGKVIGVHINDNSHTLFLEAEELASILRDHGKKIEWLDLKNE